MEYSLRQIEPGNPNPIIILLNKDEVIVGRKTVASLTIYQRVSRYHAAFHRIAGVWYVRDIGSHGNLYVNFLKVGRDMRRLEIGDIIGLGVTSFSEKDGFLCVLVAHNAVKIEMVDLEDEDTDQPEEFNTSRIGSTKIKCEEGGIKINEFDKTVKKERLDVAELVNPTGTSRTSLQLNYQINDSEVSSSVSDSSLITIKQESFPRLPQFGPIDAMQNDESTLSKETSYSNLAKEPKEKIANYPLHFQKKDLTNSMTETILKPAPTIYSFDSETINPIEMKEPECTSQPSNLIERYSKNYLLNLSEINILNEQQFPQLFDGNGVYQSQYTMVEGLKHIIHDDLLNSKNKEVILNTGNKNLRIPALKETCLKSFTNNNAMHLPIVESCTSLSEEDWLTHSSNTVIKIPEIVTETNTCHNLNSGLDFQVSNVETETIENNNLNHRLYENLNTCKIEYSVNNSVQEKVMSEIDNLSKYYIESEDTFAKYDTTEDSNYLKYGASDVSQSTSIEMDSAVTDFLEQTDSHNYSINKQDKNFVDLPSCSTESSSETEMVLKVCTIPLTRCDNRVERNELYEEKQEKPKLNGSPLKNKIRLKIIKNRLESDSSSESDDEIPPKKRCKKPIIVLTDSEVSSDFESVSDSESCNEVSRVSLKRKGTRNWDGSSESVVSTCEITSTTEEVQSPSYHYGFPTLHEDENESSDSSLSEKSTVLYPSAHVLEKLKDIPYNKSTLKPSNVINDTTSFQDDHQSRKENVTHDQIISNTKPTKAGKTLLTDPKPLIKRNRGRPRHSKDEKLFEPKNKSYLEKSIFKKRRNIHKGQDKSSADKQKSKKEAIRKKNANFQKRDTGVVMVSNSLKNFKIPKCSKKEDKEVKKNISSKENKRTPTVIRRPENYGSRMGFLTDVSSFKANPRNKRPTHKNSRNAACSDSDRKKLKSTVNKESMNFILDQLLGQQSSNLDRKESASRDVRASVEHLKNPTPQIQNKDSRSGSEKNNKPKEQAKNTTAPNVSPTLNSCVEKTKSFCKNRYTETGTLVNRAQPEVIKSLTITSNNRTDPSKNIAVITPYNFKTENFKANESRKVLSDELSLIKMIVKWNPKWLEEQKEHTRPPPILSKISENAPNFFRDHKEYSYYINSLLALRLWDLIFTKSKELFENDRWNNFYCKILSIIDHHGVTEIKCEAAVSEEISYCPYEGNVILFNTEDNENNIENCIFGYITEHKFGLLNEFSKSSEWRKIPENWMNRAKPHFFTAYIKKRRKAFNAKSLILAHGICNIKHKLNFVYNLTNFQFSPLSNKVLQPNDSLFSLDFSSIKKSKESFIKTVSDEITRNSKPNIFLVEGAPGTGKTYFILELIEKLLFHSSNKSKLFVCVSSNSAAGEIGFRLIDLIERYSWQDKTVKFVMIGDCNQLHPNLQPYHYGKMAEHNCKSRKRKETNVKESLEILSLKIQSLVLESKFPNNMVAAEKESKLKDLMSQYESIKMHSSHVLESNSKENWTFKVLNEADVIISTLNTFQEYLDNVDSNQRTVSAMTCCIMDEAGECSEPDLLQCLIKEVNSLVLVGDSKRFPLLTNRRCSRLSGRQRSMFERLFADYKGKPESPVLRLVAQYRMHSEILRFPSRYFYKDKLVFSSEIDEKSKTFPLNPYLILDIFDNQVVSNGSEGYFNIADVFNRVCLFVSSLAPGASIGAIAEDQLVALYRNFISGNRLPRRVEVNSVDGFKSREKDVMIVSVVKTHSSFGLEDFVTDEEKLNVILTRARHCLILYGHLSSLRSIKHWKALIDDAKIRKLYNCVPSITNIPSVLNESMNKFRRD